MHIYICIVQSEENQLFFNLFYFILSVFLSTVLLLPKCKQNQNRSIKWDKIHNANAERPESDTHTPNRRNVKRQIFLTMPIPYQSYLFNNTLTQTIVIFVVLIGTSNEIRLSEAEKFSVKNVLQQPISMVCQSYQSVCRDFRWQNTYVCFGCIVTFCRSLSRTGIPISSMPSMCLCVSFTFHLGHEKPQIFWFTSVNECQIQLSSIVRFSMPAIDRAANGEKRNLCVIVLCDPNA